MNPLNIQNLFIDLRDPVVFQTFGGEKIWTRVQVPQGATVFKEGDEDQDFYFIFSGTVVVNKSIKDPNASQKRMALLGPGDFFGEGALLSSRTRAATVTAQTEVVLLKMSQASFESLVAKDPHAAVGVVLGIVKVLNARLQETNERLVLLHNVAQLVRESNGSSDLALRSVVQELQSVTRYGKALVIGLDGTYKAATEGLSAEELNAIMHGFQKVMPAFLTPEASASYVEASYLYVGVYGMDARLTALLVVPISPDCLETETRLMLTVAEQIGHLV